MSPVAPKPSRIAGLAIAGRGEDVRTAVERTADVIVVGSGPGGAAVARSLARAGIDVLVLEEGPYLRPDEFPEDGFGAMSRMYRDLGGSLAMGRAPFPIVQGRAVGGTSVVNGAICWRLPRDVHDAWLVEDPALGETLGWDALVTATDTVEADLHIAPTTPDVAGRKNLLMAGAADALGLEHRPIRRNVSGCEGLGRCLQGCPRGAKLSMDRSYLPDAVEHGARIWSGVRIERVLVRGGRAIGVRGTTGGGGRFEARADRVVVAAGAVHSPVLLRRSGLKHGPVGDGFQCHPGLSVGARFTEPVRAWTGATQGHEITGLRHEGLKFEVLGFDMGLLAARAGGIGRPLAHTIGELAHHLEWGCAVKAKARGTVRPGWRRPRIRFELADDDLATARKGLRVLCELLLAAGAEEVHPGIHGWDPVVTDPNRAARLEDEAPRDPRAYTMVATHLFGTCRLASDPTKGVVRPDFRHHTTEGLYVTDASVFPSNTGVNPQTSILALATLAANHVAA